MSETSSRVVTRCYIDGDTFILRTKGRDNVVVPRPELTAATVNKLADEMIARLLLAENSVADIVAGTSIPDRVLPTPRTTGPKVPRALGKVKKAILAVKIGDLTKAARSGGSKPDKALIATQAEAWVRGLSDEQLKKLQAVEAVAVELARLRGHKASSLDEALATAGEPAPAAEEEEEA